MLAEPRYLEWRNLAILMLGESAREADRARVRDTLARKARFGSSLNLAAWATALVAVDGVDGIGRLESLYLTNKAREDDELKAVIQALSVHAKADATLRAPVAEAYRRLLDTHPRLAPDLVHDLIAWQRWDFVRQVEQARDALDADPLAAYSLGLYLRFAQAKHGARAPQWRTGTDAPAASDRTELGETP
jgi:hypothetical protein